MVRCEELVVLVVCLGCGGGGGGGEGMGCWWRRSCSGVGRWLLDDVNICCCLRVDFVL